jgi:hypothetical protein
MKRQLSSRGTRQSERGVSLYIVAASLLILLGMAALTIDLASLYVARNEAQRAADSAALAGAKLFVETGCINSGSCSGVEADAQQRAIDIGSQNQVAGQALVINPGDISFDVTSAQNPRISVQVQSPSISAFFAGALGITSGTVQAKATAEAYSPSGSTGGPTFCTGCVRPWFIGNCDPLHASPQNPLCAGTQGYLLDPNSNYSVANPLCVTQGGIVGETLDVKIETQPSQFGAVDAGSGLAGYQQSITTCNTGQFTCGDTFNTLSGGTQAFTTQGVDTLLHLSNNTTGLNQGQDWIDTTACPLQIHAGARNPLVLQGVLPQDARMSTSDSVVTVFVYDGTQLPPGPQPNLRIVGFAQLFVTQVEPSGDVWGVILGAAGCGNSSGNCGSGSRISGGGAVMIPVRLVQSPGP